MLADLCGNIVPCISMSEYLENTKGCDLQNGGGEFAGYKGNF